MPKTLDGLKDNYLELRRQYDSEPDQYRRSAIGANCIKAATELMHACDHSLTAELRMLRHDFKEYKWWFIPCYPKDEDYVPWRKACCICGQIESFANGQKEAKLLVGEPFFVANLIDSFGVWMASLALIESWFVTPLPALRDEAEHMLAERKKGGK